jgi:hypothetical protein
LNYPQGRDLYDRIFPVSAGIHQSVLSVITPLEMSMMKAYKKLTVDTAVADA